MAAAKQNAAELAARLGDALISTSPETEVIEAYRSAGGEGPRYGQLTVCWGEDEATARRLAHEIWPNAGAPGRLSQELPLPSDFEALGTLVTEEQIAEQIVCGPDPAGYAAGLRKFEDAGFDHVAIHQIGPDQEGFLHFYERELAVTV